MRLVFFGTSDFGIPALRALHRHAEVSAVVTTREKPAGRGLRLAPSPVKLVAQELGVRLFEPETPNRPEFAAELRRLAPDLIVLAAYRFILKPEILGIPGRGALNLHPSLLPCYRGAAPIQRALMNGETRTGVSLFLMNERIDEGDLVRQQELTIQPDETFAELSRRLAQLTAELVLDTLPLIDSGRFERLHQDPARASYAAKLSREERVINWNWNAVRIHNLVRALTPVPAAYTMLRGKRLEILQTRPAPNLSARPGELIIADRTLFCGTGTAALALLQVKPEGRRAMSGADLINGHRISSGEEIGS